jgi:N-acetyl-gamma-glutamyl-phosphate reductase
MNTSPSAPTSRLLKIDADKRKDIAERKRLINESDVTFLCLPDDAAKESVALVDNAEYLRHRRLDRAPGQPGLGFRPARTGQGSARQNRGSKRIANPGCHASAFILALKPLVAAGCCRLIRRLQPIRSPAIPVAARR